MTCSNCDHSEDDHRIDGMGGYCLRILTDDETGEPDEPGQSCGCPGYAEAPEEDGA